MDTFCCFLGVPFRKRRAIRERIARAHAHFVGWRPESFVVAVIFDTLQSGERDALELRRVSEISGVSEKQIDAAVKALHKLSV